MKKRFTDFMMWETVRAQSLRDDETPRPEWWWPLLEAYKQEFGDQAPLDSITHAVDALAELYLQTKREDLRFVMKIKAEQDFSI